VLWLHYEDLHQDLPAAVKLIAEFLGLGADNPGGFHDLQGGCTCTLHHCSGLMLSRTLPWVAAWMWVASAVGLNSAG
jgi:hypothetical protein